MCTSANSRSSAALLAALVLGSCGLAPKYAAPPTPAPAAFKELPPDAAGVAWAPAAPADAAARGKWWTLFGDSQLNDFEDRLSGANQNVAAAASAFLAARATVAAARAQYYPTVVAAPGATRSRVSATPFGTPANLTYTEYSLPFDGSWQPDFWGKTRSAVASAEFAAQASAADLENVRLTAHAELAVDYYQLRAQDELTVLLDSAAAADREGLELARALFAGGLASEESVAQAQAQLEAAQAQAANAAILRAQYEHAIATLLGVSASSFSLSRAPFAPPVAAVPVGVPSQLLERRPDVASAERAAAAANQQIGIARAAYFPNVTLSASAGFDAFSPSSWLTWPSRFWSLGAGADETLFDAGARAAALRQSHAEYDQAVAAYRQTVLAAFQQVEDSLAAVRISSEDARRQDAAVSSARRGLVEAQARFAGGLDPYQNVLTARSALIALQQTAVALRVQEVVAEVGLVEALGGGWERARLPSRAELRR